MPCRIDDGIRKDGSEDHLSNTDLEIPLFSKR